MTIEVVLRSAFMVSVVGGVFRTRISSGRQGPLLGILFRVLLWAPGHAFASPDVLPIIERAREARGEGHFEKALEHLTSASTLRPDTTTAGFFWAEVAANHWMLGAWDRASVAGARALRRLPTVELPGMNSARPCLHALVERGFEDAEIGELVAEEVRTSGPGFRCPIVLDASAIAVSQTLPLPESSSLGPFSMAAYGVAGVATATAIVLAIVATQTRLEADRQALAGFEADRVKATFENGRRQSIAADISIVTALLGWTCGWLAR